MADMADRIKKIFCALLKNGVKESALKYSSPYELLVAVVLSAQTTDIAVNKVTEKLFPLANTPKKIVALGEERLGDAIKSLGLWRNKAKNIISLSQKLINEFGGEVPREREKLLSLPGVGEKSSAVVLNLYWGEPLVAVDTHVARVAKRLGLTNNNDPKKIETDLERIVPKEYLSVAHHALIWHGRDCCRAKKPHCMECPIKEFCHFKSIN